MALSLQEHERAALELELRGRPKRTRRHVAGGVHERLPPGRAPGRQLKGERLSTLSMLLSEYNARKIQSLLHITLSD